MNQLIKSTQNAGILNENVFIDKQIQKVAILNLFVVLFNWLK